MKNLITIPIKFARKAVPETTEQMKTISLSALGAIIHAGIPSVSMKEIAESAVV